MIEVPRAALVADKIAARGRVLLVRHERPDPVDLRLQSRRHQGVHADLSEGEDPARSIPFQSLDVNGVGQCSIEMGVQKGRAGAESIGRTNT